MLSIQKKISAYNHFSGNNIQYIVVHDVGTRSNAKNNVDYFFGGNRNASAHYFVDDSSIWQSVEDWNGAWHVGDGNGVYGISNTNSIGIEMCLPTGTVTAKTEQNTLELVQYLMKKYNLPASRVVRHYDASRKNCPAQFNLDGRWTRWNAFKNKLVSGGGSTTPTPAPSTKAAHLDVVNVNSGAFNVKGWFIPNKSTAKQTIWMYFMDKATNKEIGRIQGKRVKRPDVKKAYPKNPNGEDVGFEINGATPTALMGKKYYILLRYNNDSKEEIYLSGQVFNAPANINTGCLDEINGSNGKVKFRGWHLNSKRRGNDKHFLFIMDKATNKELARFDITGASNKASADVAKGYNGTIAQRSNCRFDFTGKLDAKHPARGKNVRLLSRYCTDPKGNTGTSNEMYFSNTFKL